MYGHRLIPSVDPVAVHPPAAGGAMTDGARIVLCVRRSPVPQDSRVWQEARTLAGAGHDVTVVCPRGTGQARRELLDEVDIVRYPAPRAAAGPAGRLVDTVAGLLWTAWYLLLLQRTAPVDVLHAADPPDTYGLLARAMRRRGTRYVHDGRDLGRELLRDRAPAVPQLVLVRES